MSLVFVSMSSLLSLFLVSSLLLIWLFLLLELFSMLVKHFVVMFGSWVLFSSDTAVVVGRTQCLSKASRIACLEIARGWNFSLKKILFPLSSSLVVDVVVGSVSSMERFILNMASSKIGSRSGLRCPRAMSRVNSFLTIV